MYSGIEKGNATLTIYNLIGELILQKELSNSTDQVDISQLNKGIYMIQISTADKMLQQKLIKE